MKIIDFEPPVYVTVPKNSLYFYGAGRVIIMFITDLY